MILWGNIGEFPLFTVLQFLASQRRTGILEIQDFEEYGAIYMSRGRIEAISLPQADEELGQRLVVAGAMTETQVKECWMNWSNSETGLPLLAHLLETARSEHAALVKIVDRHTADQVMQLMYWSAGTFRFTIPTETIRFPVVPSIDVENFLLTVAEVLTENGSSKASGGRHRGFPRNRKRDRKQAPRRVPPAPIESCAPLR